MTNVIYNVPFGRKQQTETSRFAASLTCFHLDPIAGGCELTLYGDTLSAKQMIVLGEALLRNAKEIQPSLFTKPIRNKTMGKKVARGRKSLKELLLDGSSDPTE